VSRQLDIFGRSHSRPAPSKPAIQPALFTWEHERAADAEDLAVELDRWRRASNPEDDSDDRPVE
jgi:hypothetical protein